MLFACKGLIAKQLYALHVNFELLVFVRAAFALPLFWSYGAHREGLRQILRTPPAAIGAAAIAGVLCYYIGALSDFYALTMIDASIERVLLFSYPAMIVLFVSARARRWPTRTAVTAVLLTWAGIFMAIGGFDHRSLQANVAGALLVLLSALSFAIYYMFSEKYTRQIGAARFTLFAMSAATLALLLHAVLRHDFVSVAQIPAAGWWWLILLAVLCMFVPALLQAEGVRRIGAQRGSVISTLGPPTTILLAWALLGERLSLWQLLGVTLIVVSVLWLERAPSKPTRAAPCTQSDNR